MIKTNRFSILQPDLLGTLVDEVQSEGFRNLVTKEAFEGSHRRVPEFRVSMCTDLLWVWFCFDANYPSDQLEAFRLFRRWAEFYIEARTLGHSTNYICTAIQESHNRKLVPAEERLAYLLSNQCIPSGWLQRCEAAGHWVVVDGKFAWLYDQLGFSQRRDAQEYDPTLKPKFEAARQLLKRSESGVNPALRSAYDRNRELKSILKKEFGIEWFTPSDLQDYE